MTEFKKAYHYAKEFRGKIHLAFVLILLSVVLGIVPYVIAYYIILGLIQGPPMTAGYIFMMSGLIFLVMAGKALFYYKGLAASHEATYDTLMGMRVAFSDKMMTMPLGEINRKGRGSFKKNIIEDIDSMEVLLAHMIPEGIPYIIVPVIVFSILLVMDWRLGLLSMGSIPFGIIPMVFMMKIGTDRLDGFYRSAERMNAVIVEYVTAMNVIKIFGRTTESFDRYVKSVNDYKNFTLAWRKESWNYIAVYSAVLPCTLILLLPVGSVLYLNGTLPLDRFIFSIMLTLGIGVPLVKMLDFIPILPTLSFKINELEKTFQGEELIQGTDKPCLTHHDIAFDRVCFAYDETDAVTDVSFTARQNRLTAIVGESGSGKSTLAKLLVHYWDVRSGTIKIGGKDIKTMPLESLMGLISYVSQDTFLFNTTVRDNIRVGNPNATDEQIVHAAKLARCHDFISGFEDGYDTRVGDAGDRMSGGEKQRVTIARAILKDAPIIVLDEATAFTDPENEDRIQEALMEMIWGKTVIIIAHRLSTVIQADSILVMHQGKLVDHGSHKKLLTTSPVYRRLWESHQVALDWRIEVKEEAHV
jgi:ATP-binding cassette subfamily B protein